VPGQLAAVVGAAALASVTVRQAAMHAQGGVHRPDRLAGLGRVDLERSALGDGGGGLVEHG